MTDLDHAYALLDHAKRAEDETWLTVKEFAAKYAMEPKSVYEAIRDNRLNFEWVKLTTGKRSRAIRIGPPKKAA